MGAEKSMRGGRSRGGGRPQRRRKIPSSLEGFESPLVKERRRQKHQVIGETEDEKGGENENNDEDESSDEDESWASEDDPDRLWCICQQPHNNR